MHLVHFNVCENWIVTGICAVMFFPFLHVDLTVFRAVICHFAVRVSWVI